MTGLACEKCGGDLEQLETPVGAVLHCLGCDRAVPMRATALKLPGLDPGRQEVYVHETEEPVLQRVIKTLTLLGYQVETLVRRRKMQTCEKCEWRFHQQGSDGVSKFVGDLLVAIPREAPVSWILLDTKGSRGVKSAGQKETAAKGLLYFAKSDKEAVLAVQEAEARLVNARSITQGGAE